ncbi:MAG: hypothetical protein R3B70_15810 [Polyangiaceae bacterium]
MGARLERAFFSALARTATLGADPRAPRLLAPLRDATWAFLSEALSAEEKSRLAVALYEVSTAYRDSPQHVWEQQWLEKRLPPPPARLLVGAAGAGREVLFLLGRGYEVLALEPTPALAQACRAQTRGAAEVIELRYEELAPEAAGATSDPGARESAGAARDAGARKSAGAASDAIAGERFDAVLLGLGSLSHLLDAGTRLAVLRALARMCPRGPILATALTPPARPRPDSRASRIVRALARPLRAARHLPPVDPGEIPFGGLGFVKLFTRGELVSMCATLERTAAFDEGAPDGLALCSFEVTGGVAESARDRS